MSAVPMTRVSSRVPYLLGGSGLHGAPHPPRRALPMLFLPWVDVHSIAEPVRALIHAER